MALSQIRKVPNTHFKRKRWKGVRRWDGDYIFYNKHTNELLQSLAMVCYGRSSVGVLKQTEIDSWSKLAKSRITDRLFLIERGINIVLMCKINRFSWKVEDTAILRLLAM